jgi:hypothetical protein
MAYASDLVTKISRRLHNYGDRDSLSTTASSTVTSIGVGNTSSYKVNDKIQIDNEVLLVSAVPTTSTQITVVRALEETTAALHNTASEILKNVFWTRQEIFEALCRAIDWLYPDLFSLVKDESLTVATGTYDYTIPATIDQLYRVYYRSSSTSNFESLIEWEQIGTKLVLTYLPTIGSTLRLVGISPYTTPTAMGSTLDIPTYAQGCVITYSLSELYDDMISDKARYDKYSAVVINEGATEADLTTMARKLRLEAEDRKRELQMNPPSIKR